MDMIFQVSAATWPERFPVASFMYRKDAVAFCNAENDAIQADLLDIEDEIAQLFPRRVFGPERITREQAREMSFRDNS